MEEFSVGTTLLLIAVVLLAARLSSFVERLGQPAVLGEILIGVLLGNLFLAGIPIFEPIKHNPIIEFLAELGVVILLFQVGLETNIREMSQVGGRALLVALVGVAAPFALATYLVGPLLLPGLSANTYLFLGATLSATSVGITARVFRDLGALQWPEARIVLGAAVIDDVLGLIILAVVSAIVTVGMVSATDVSLILLKALGFLAGAVFLGQLLAPLLGRALSRIHTGTGMKFTLALCFGLICAFFAELIGLAPIVGAFAAGLVLDPVHFEWFDSPQVVVELRTELGRGQLNVSEQVETIIQRHADHHVDRLIEPIGHLLIPIFFVLTGMSVQLQTLFDPGIMLVALAVTAAAIAGKAVAGLAAGPVNKQLVGWGMVPRGEVGLIFAAAGQSLGILTGQTFSVVVIMVLLTTLITPPILTVIIRRAEVR
jgi:Kef-type K+ transport system membrane component KefB